MGFDWNWNDAVQGGVKGGVKGWIPGAIAGTLEGGFSGSDGTHQEKWLQYADPMNLGNGGGYGGNVGGGGGGGGKGGLPGKGGSSAPASPDFQGLATQQDISNHSNVNTPWGSESWSRDPTTGQWTQGVGLNPYEAGALDAQQQQQYGRSQMGSAMLPDAANALARGIDWGKFGQMGTGDQARDQAITGAYNQAASRLDPQWSHQEQSIQQQLAAQGLGSGDQAYENAMADFARNKNDAYSSAMNSAIGQGTAAQAATFGENLQSRQQGVSEAYQQQYGPMQAYNYMMNGQQVAMPAYPGEGTAGGQYLQAGMQQYGSNVNAYNASQMQQQGTMNGLGQMAPYAFNAFQNGKNNNSGGGGYSDVAGGDWSAGPTDTAGGYA